VAEKAYCAAVGLRSNLTIPLKRSGRPIAALAVACFRRERHWPADLIPRLRLLGEVFLNAVARRNQAVALESALAEIRGLKAQLEEENLYLRKEIDVATRAGGGIVGEGAAIKNALVQAEQVAPTDATVLLLGETGTGKELMARTIHALSTRQGRTMVRLNCAALPPTLIESELFGRERGAYTGALAKQMGRFELADGSTIFLDEIGELPLELQPKLLRAIQDQEFERVGGNRTIRTDVRFVAATNRDLKAMVDEFSRFARLPAASMVSTNVNLLIEQTLASYNGRLDGVHLDASLAPELPEIKADPEQLKRVFVNLIDNALEALEDASEKELSLTSSFYPNRHTVEVVVKDTGHGISSADKEKLFLPYFSTKRRGTGLGLAIARGFRDLNLCEYPADHERVASAHIRVP
jgi:signal transduction histidine kinase